MPLILGTNSIKDTGYDVANSLRFDGASSAYLNRTHGASGSTRKMTLSFWIKKCVSKDHGQADGMQILGGQQDNYPGFICMFQRSTDTFIFRDAQAANDVKFDVRTDAKFRDFSAWMHIVVAMDTTQGTAANRIKIYINGTQTTDLNGVGTTGGGTDDPLYPDQNFDSQFNSNEAHFINKYATNYEDFYLCEYCFIDGQQLDATSFGEFDSDTGIWKPIDVSGLTFGTNGFYLDFKNSGSLGNDAAGSNNWTTNNIAATDQSTDTCTNNFATWNPLNTTPVSSSYVLSEGNLKISLGGGTERKAGTSTFGLSSGKWYWEVKFVSETGTSFFGIGVTGEENLSGEAFANGALDYAYKQNGQKENNSTVASFGTAISAGDIVGVALDLDNLKIYFSLNGTFQNSGDPTSGATGTGSAYTLTAISSTETGFYFPTVGKEDPDTAVFEFNFGSPSFSISSGNTDGNGYGNFEYAVPSGYYALNTKNLAEYG